MVRMPTASLHLLQLSRGIHYDFWNYQIRRFGSPVIFCRFRQWGDSYRSTPWLPNLYRHCPTRRNGNQKYLWNTSKRGLRHRFSWTCALHRGKNLSWIWSGLQIWRDAGRRSGILLREAEAHRHPHAGPHRRKHVLCPSWPRYWRGTCNCLYRRRPLHRRRRPNRSLRTQGSPSDGRKLVQQHLQKDPPLRRWSDPLPCSRCRISLRRRH